MDEQPKFNIKDGLSIDEAKVSVLIILCILTFLFALVMYAVKGDISTNLTDVLEVLVCVIGGVNIGNSIMTIFSKRGGSAK